MRVLIGLVVFIVTYVAIGSIQGPTVCRDGWRSPSIGRSGACSHHGGIDRGPAGLRFIVSLLLGIGSGFLPQTLASLRNAGSAESETSNRQTAQARDTSRDRPCRRCGGVMRPIMFKPKSSPPRAIWQCLDFPACIGAETVAGFEYTYESEDLQDAVEKRQGREVA